MKIKALEYFGIGTSWKLWKKKGSDGAHSVGEHGGFYTETDANGKVVARALIKCEGGNVSANISEFLGSRIFGAIAPGYGAEVSLTIPKSSEEKALPKDGTGVYVRSKFFENYANDMYVDMDENMSKSTAPSKFFRAPAEEGKLGRPYMMGSRDVLGNTLGNAFDELNYQGFDQVAPTSLLIGDFDVHTGNIGVIRDKKNPGLPPKLVRIDFGAAFTNLSNDVHPHSRARHLPGQGPTNHFREFPSKLKLNDQFVESLFTAANKNLDQEIDKSFQELGTYYSPKVLAQWAKQSMPGQFKNKKLEDIKIDDIKDQFKEIMRHRQQSLKEFALEIKLGLLIEKKTDGKVGFKSEQAEIEFKQLCKENEKYFSDIANKKKSFKFRDHNLVGFFTQSTAERFITRQIREVVAANKKPIIDTVVVSESKHNNRALNAAAVITREILSKQLDILYKMIGAIHPEVVRLSKEEFQAYLKAPENKEKIDKALAHPTIKQNFEKEIHETEVAGYKKLHEEFKDNLKPINWDSKAPKGEEKSQVIKNNEGQEICTLTEKTVKSSSTIALADGNTKEVASYRTIDFPKSLKEGAVGPMHVSLAVKDELGNNIAAEKAVYFTAHYDKAGKLTEVSSPQPVKFTGTGADAVGYIEREGKIYTLPVTQGKYKEMMQEVEVNKGTAVDLSQKMKGVEPKIEEQGKHTKKLLEERVNKQKDVQDVQKGSSFHL